MLENKNIVIFISSLAGGGGEREASILANYFAEKNNVRILMLNDSIEYELDPKVQVDYLDKNKSNNKSKLYNIAVMPILAQKYKKYLKLHKADLNIAFLTRPNIIAGMSKSLGNKGKTILCEVTTLGQAYPNNALANKLMRRLVKTFYPKADLVIPNSKGSEKELNEVFGVTKTENIYNPLNIEWAKEMAAEPSEHPIDPQKFSFVNVGGFKYPKDYDTLLKAYSKVDDIENTELVLVGKGKSEDKYKQMAKDLGIEEQVKFVGFSKNPFTYLANSDSFVFSSFFEGFPNAMQEALIFGLPIISNDCKNGPREMMTNEDVGTEIFEQSPLYEGKVGYLYPTQDVEAFTLAMNKIRQDKEAYSRFSRNASLEAENYTIDRIMQRFEKVISDLLA